MPGSPGRRSNEARGSGTSVRRDDLDQLRHDPALLIAVNRAPESGLAIPRQPTISRLENVADARSLYRIGIGFIDLFCHGFAKPPAKLVVLTARGRSAYDAAIAGQAPWARGLVNGLSARQIETATATLRTIRRRLEVQGQQENNNA